MSIKSDVMELNEMMNHSLNQLLGSSGTSNIARMSSEELIAFRDLFKVIEKSEELLEKWADIIDKIPEMKD